MKTFFATALLAASAFAVEQSVAPEPIVAKADSDDMWTNDDIKDHVSENFGAEEWDAFTASHLVSEETIQTIASNISTSIHDRWVAGLEHLPNVCEPGIACRNEIYE
jgi:hypothetical protein